MHSRFLLCIAPLVAANAAQAQLPPIRFDYNDETPWPAGQTVPNAFTRQIAGDFDGNGLMDVMLLEKESAGGKVVFYPQPDSWPFQATAWETNGPLVDDIDLIPASAGQPARVAMVGANGLDVLIYAPDNGIPVNGGRMGPYFAWDTISHDALWQGAKLVRAGQLDAGGTDLDYVGVKDAVNASTQQLESTVIVRQKIGSSTTTISFTLPGVIVHDAFIGQWNDTADNEIFLLDTSGVEIYTPAGVRVRRFVRPYADDGKDVFCGFKKNIVVNGVQVPEGKLHVAWFRRKTLSGIDSQELVELNAPAVTIATGIAFPYDDVAVSAVSGDSPLLDSGGASYLPADGNQELAVRQAANNSLTVYENAGPASAYAPASFNEGLRQAIGTGDQLGVQLDLYSTSQRMAAPVYADLSGDGVADLFVPVLGTDFNDSPRVSTVIYDGSNFIPTTFVGEPLVGANPDVIIDYATRSTVASNYINQITPGLDLTLYLQALSPPPGATAVEVYAWERNASTGEYSAVSPEHGYYDYVAPTTITASTSMFVRVPLPAWLRNSPPANQTGWTTQYLYEIHFAQWSGSSLVAMGTNHVVMLGENVAATYSYFTQGFSDPECVGGLPLTSSEPAYDCGVDAFTGGGPSSGTQPVHSPVSFNRHRLPSLPNGNPAPLPVPSSAVRYQQAGNSIAFNGL